MSIMDLDGIGARNLIAQYVLSCRNQGLFLPYEDYEVIDQWLARVADADDLLLILSDVLPPLYEKAAGRRHPPSLKSINKRIQKKLDDRAKRHCFKSADDSLPPRRKVLTIEGD